MNVWRARASRMAVHLTETDARSILTRASGYLRDVASHSLQPYRGCTFGRSLCGVGCYVQHNAFLTRGAPWGSFLEVKRNAAERYLAERKRERAWAHRAGRAFGVFMSSATDPFVPHERRYRISERVLEAMLGAPPDVLIVQTHTHRVSEYSELLARLAARCDLRVHVSIESDRDRLPGLPPPASSVERRFAGCAALRRAKVPVVVTVSPLLPIRDPEGFFARIAAHADGVVVDHYIGGDGSADGGRTRATGLPEAMARVEPESVGVAYRDRMVRVAETYLPGRVGVGAQGFAGHFLPRRAG